MTDAQFVLSADELEALRQEAGTSEPVSPEDLELGRTERGFRRRMAVIEPRLARVPIAATATFSKALGGACTIDAMRGAVIGPSGCLQSLRVTPYVANLVVGEDILAGLLAFNAPLCFGLVERAFGATVSVPKDDSDARPGYKLTRCVLTVVERETIQPVAVEVTRVIADSLNLPGLWKLALVPLEVGTEPQLGDDTENAFLWRMTIRMGRYEGQIMLVVLPGLADVVLGVADQARQIVDPAWIAQHIARSSIELTAVLGRARLSLADVLGLRVGDVLRLDQGQRDSIAVQLERCTKYRGRPVQLGGVFGVEIVQEETA